MFPRMLPMGFLIVASVGCASARAQVAPPAQAPKKAPPLENTSVPLAPSAKPTPPKPPEFAKSFAGAFAFEAANRVSSAQPQLLVLTEMSPQAMTDWTEDLRVMSRLVNDTIIRVSNGENRRAMGIRIRTLDNSPATYLEGFGVLLTADTSIPLAASGKATTAESDSPLPVDAWELARRQLNVVTDNYTTGVELSQLAADLATKQREQLQAGLNGGSAADREKLQSVITDLQQRMADAQKELSLSPGRIFTSPPIAPFDAGRLGVLIDAMNQTLAQATHFRHLQDDNVVWLTVSGTDDAGKPMRLNFRVGSSDLKQFASNVITADELQRRITHFVY